MHKIIASCPFWALFLCAFLLGAMNVLAFAPLGIWPLQLLGLSGLFCLLYSSHTHIHGARRVALLTGSYCFAWMFFGVIWLTVTMFRYGDMPVWLSFFCVALFCVALACLPASLMYCAARIRLRYALPAWVVCLVLFPTFWSLAEWTRGWLFTGFPWLVSGYAHTVSPLAGYAPVIGVYGIGWLTAVIAGCMVLMVERQRKAGLLAVAIGVLGAALHLVAWTVPSGAPMTVRLLQGNVDQEIKFEREHLIDSLQFYFEAITKKPADLIVTPESALPLPKQALPDGYFDQLQKYSTETHSTIGLGLFSNDGVDLFSNTMVSVTPVAMNQPYRYDKHHLVPFGEFIPAGFAWFYHYMHIPMGDLQRGPLLIAPFPVKDQQILPNICYEDVFGEEIAARISYAYFSNRAVPTILLNMTNISWFGDSWAMPQHLQITQMRTLETGRPMLRSTNTGVTALVNAQGKVVDQLAPFMRGELDVTVQGYQGMTPYIVCGNLLWLALMGCIALLTTGVIAATVRRKQTAQSGSANNRTQ